MGYATLCPAVLSAPRAMAAEIDTESIAEEIAQFHRRLEGWLARRRLSGEPACTRGRAGAAAGRPLRTGGRKHPVSAPGPRCDHVQPRGAGPRGEGGDVADARAAADARPARSPHAP